MPICWYIDALDPLGGRAFATWRGPGVFEDEIAEAPGRTVFIGPPTFQAEPLSGMAIGLAATRAAFQAGVYDEEDEIPFPTIQAVSEFVRRIFLAGAGGEGPGPGGGPSGPGGEGLPGLEPGMLAEIEKRMEEGVETVEGEERLGDPFPEIIAKAEAFGGLEPPPRGQVQPVSFLSTFEPRPRSVSAAAVPGQAQLTSSDRLGRAAAYLLEELIKRAPIGRPADEKIRWANSANRFAALLERQHLFYWLEFDQFGVRFRKKIRDSFAHLMNHSATRGTLEYALLCPGLRQLAFSSLEEFVNYEWRMFRDSVFPFPYADRALSEFAKMPFDALPHLQVLGLPEWVSNGLDFGKVPTGRASLWNLLCLFCASPELMFREQVEWRQAEARFDLVLLAATVITSQSTEAPHLDPMPPWYYDTHGVASLVAASHDWIVKEACIWLSQNTPSLAFSKSVENIIISARSAAYA